MKKISKISAFIISLAFATNVYAGKTEDIQAVVKKTCSKDIPTDEALRLVKELYLGCNDGSKVDVGGGCSVPCLKTSSGKVVGQ